MPNIPKTTAHVVANALPVYRVYRGYKTAESLRTNMHDPSKRTWAFGRGVLLDALTDTLDGQLARYAGPTKLGGYLDQMADKAWFLQISRQLVTNGEIADYNFKIPLGRDLGMIALRPIAQHYGLNPDAKASGKLKMVAQVGAVVSACSPIAHAYPEFTQDMFALATGSSIVSGADMIKGYRDEISERFKSEPIAQLVVASTTLLDVT